MRRDHPQARGKLPLQLTHPDDEGLRLDDWLVDLHARSPDATPVWVDLKAGQLFSQAGKNAPVPREDALLTAWVRSLASAACGCPAEGILIGPGALLTVRPPEPDAARALLLDLMQALRSGLFGPEPLPTAVKTGVAWLQESDAAKAAYEGHFGSPVPGEGHEPCLSRLFADFDNLASQPGFDGASRRLYGAYVEWLCTHVTVQALTVDGTSPDGQGDTDD